MWNFPYQYGFYLDCDSQTTTKEIGFKTAWTTQDSCNYQVSTLKKDGAPVFSISSSQATNNVNPTKVKVSYLEWSWLSKDRPENIYSLQTEARGY